MCQLIYQFWSARLKFEVDISRDRTYVPFSYYRKFMEISMLDESRQFLVEFFSKILLDFVITRFFRSKLPTSSCSNNVHLSLVATDVFLNSSWHLLFYSHFDELFGYF